MIYEADYTIEIKSGKPVNLLFNSYFFRDFCIKKGIELEDLFDLIGQGKAFKGNDLPLLLLRSAYAYNRYNSPTEPFSYNDEDACLWIDEMGGFNSAKLVGIYKIFVCKLSNIDPEKFDVVLKEAAEKKDEEKKKEPVSV